MAIPILEVCVDSVESAMEAQAGGANRLELCGNLVIGGTTPSVELFKAVRVAVDRKIHVLIRPRFGDFLYTEHEFDLMKREVVAFKALGADGIVIGCLKSDGSIDVGRMSELVALAKGMSVTLHRAFDMCKEPMIALEQAKCLGVETILTSGQQNHCVKGKSLIKQLMKQAGAEIEILVGGGVNADVVRQMISEGIVTSFHMSGKVICESGMEYRNTQVNMGIPGMSEYEIWQADRRHIESVYRLLHQEIKRQE